ncbi:progesterone receptor [Solea solea]|uniref:progesterone receptor n=1 Tax=Solea solea TaxID=90069 RepID=UPI00272D8452|nr:progesterone receptor [Solea solea]
MNAISSPIAESTDTRLGDFNTAYSNIKMSNEAQVLTCMSSVRNFGNIGALIHGLCPSGEGAVSKECNILDASLASKYYYDRGSELVKCDSVVPWGDFVKVPRTDVAISETVPEAGSLSSTAGACKFIKDEKETSAIMDRACPDFDPSPELSALDSCCDTYRKQQPQSQQPQQPQSQQSQQPQSQQSQPQQQQQHQHQQQQQLSLSDSELTNFGPVTIAPPPGMEGSPNFLIDLNQAEQLPALNQVRTDSRCGLSGTMYRNELVPRWQMQTSLAEPQYWCQSTGLNDDPFTHSGYEVIQSQGFVQRNSSPFSTFPGMPPQRQCMICGDEASGCHYGVLTCGSCKVFFKRAVEGHHSYLCAGRNDCIVDKIRRKNCPACRLRKCYQAGMMLGGRKLKRFGALKALGIPSSLMFQSHLAMSGNNQALNAMSCIPGIHDVQVNSQIIDILENIEPEVMCSGHDSLQSDVPHVLLNSLNRLCEKQLLWIVKWSKSLPGFRNLHINDQMTLIQYSWMNLMVFSLGWRSFQNVTSEYLYFAPDLILSQEQMRRTSIFDLCLAIQFIPQEFANLQVSREEFLCMKAIILLNTVPLEGLKSQAAFEEMRQNYIHELTKAIHIKEKGMVASSQRFYRLTKLMDVMHEIVKKVNLFCLSTFIQADAMSVEFPEMMSEVIASQLPKVLAGMVRPLLFHSK